MKKALKILLIVILVLVTIIIGYYAYLKIQISREQKRLEKEESELMQLDADYKYIVEQLPYTSEGDFHSIYEIDFENKKVIEKTICLSVPLTVKNESEYSGIIEHVKGLIEETILHVPKTKLEYLRDIEHGKKVKEKALSDEESIELKQLLDDIISNKMGNRKEQKDNSIGVIWFSTYKISTKNKKDIEFDNKELINQFLNLVK